MSGRRAALVAVVVVLAVALGSVLVVQQRRAQQERLDRAARVAADAFAAGVQTGDLGAAVTPPESAAAQEDYAAIVAGLGGATPTVEVLGVTRTEQTATAQLRWTWPFGPQGWRYETSVDLAGEGESAWSAVWAESAVHPDLAEADLLVAERTAAERADVLGRTEPLVAPTPVVEVGVQPSRATDPAGLARTLGALLDVDAAPLEQRIRSARPDAFVPVIVLRRSDYDAVRAQLQPLPGTVFRESTRPLAPTREFARALLGTAGPVTAELVEQSGGRLVPGDVAGLSGVQRRHDERLAGTSGVTVERVDGDRRVELFRVAPVPGEPVQLTLDVAVQQAADAALAGADGDTASLVALDVGTGDVLAVANTPAVGADRATTGRYAPGSTFKPVTTLALLGAGLRPDDSVPCPPTATVDGRSFRNFEGGALGAVPFRTAFAQSCNTAFVGLADRVEPAALPAAATSLGLGVPWQVGVDVFAGDVPVPASPVDEAASMIGQGKLLASPAAMAQVAATIARGSWLAPRLVLQPEPGPAPTAPPTADPAALATLQSLMREVVVAGTASALADVPGAPVHAKTGTAEYGTESPPRTHAWMIGFQGSVAFAVIVEQGSSGGAVAVPVGESFLRALAGQ